MREYLLVMSVAALPLVELRGAAPLSQFYGLKIIPSFLLCILGNMLPVPFIYFFARRILEWGSRKKGIGKFFLFFLKKGENAGVKISSAMKNSLFFALFLFVALPLPGTGAWTGTLGASFLNLGFKKTVICVCAGVIAAGVIMMLLSLGIIRGVKIFSH